MPDILTHNYCAYFSRSRLDLNTVISHILHKYEDAFFFGAQGPDFLFYYQLWPWCDNKNFSHHAETIHKYRTLSFLKTAFQNLSTKDLSLVKTQKILAYWMGFLTHYALDTCAHPYIYYHSGIYKKGYSSKREAHNHKFFENILDTLMAEIHSHNKNLPPVQRLCLPQNIKGLEPVYKNISSIYANVYGTHISSRDIKRALIDMKAIVNVLSDIHFKKRAIGSCIEKLMGTPNFVTTAFHPAKFNRSKDYLNLTHRTWFHPCDKSIVFEKSFLDIFEQAISFSVDLISQAWKEYKLRGNFESLGLLLGDLSYDTGLNWKDCRSLSYSHSIL